MESPEQSESVNEASVNQRNMDNQESEAALRTMTSSQSQIRKRSSSFILEENMAFAGGKRLVIKPVTDVVTLHVGNMIVSEQLTAESSDPEAQVDEKKTKPASIQHTTTESHQKGQFGYQPHQGNGLLQRHPQRQYNQQPAAAHVRHSAQLQRQHSSIHIRSHSHDQPRQRLPRHVRKLTETITAFTDEPLSAKAHVYPGEQRMGGMLETRLIAVKVVRHTPMKMREAKNLVKLTPHVNVVSIYHADLLAGSFEPRIYLVMEKCNPLTLECYIKERKLAKIPFNTTLALDIGKQIIEGINHIHKKNIIHRDLKPSGVLFSLCGKFVKIIDFGMSKELKYGLSVMSLSTLYLGTDGYRAPETYNKDEIKKEADIFALGILLYHVWSNGCHPFGLGPDIWSYNIKNHEPPDFSQLLIPNADSASDLLKGMLKNDPEQRITIDDVKAHPFIKQTIEDTVNKDVTPVWYGSIQQVSDESTETLENCTLSRNTNGPPVELDSFAWRLNMHCLPNFDRKKISLPICKIPVGYLAMKKSYMKKLSKKLSEEKKMACIDIYNDNDERIRSLMIIRPEGYDDLYGVMVTNPDKFMEKILGCSPKKKETTPKELAEEMEQSQTDRSPALEKAIDTSEEGTSSQQEALEATANSVASQVTADPVVDEPVEVVTRHEVPSRRPLGQLEFVAWWQPEVEEVSSSKS